MIYLDEFNIVISSTLEEATWAKPLVIKVEMYYAFKFLGGKVTL